MLISREMAADTNASQEVIHARMQFLRKFITDLSNDTQIMTREIQQRQERLKEAALCIDFCEKELAGLEHRVV
jgi:hypothetical protein